MKLYLENPCGWFDEIDYDNPPPSEYFVYELELAEHTVSNTYPYFSFRITSIYDDRVTIECNDSMGYGTEEGFAFMGDLKSVFDVYKDKKLHLHTAGCCDAGETYIFGLHDSREESYLCQKKDSEERSRKFNELMKQAEETIK